jgi:hypothetical protein
LINAVLTEKHLPRLRVNKMGVSGRVAALHVEHNRLVSLTYAVCRRRESDQACALWMRVSLNLKERPTLILANVRDSAGKNDASQVCRSLAPGDRRRKDASRSGCPVVRAVLGFCRFQCGLIRDRGQSSRVVSDRRRRDVSDTSIRDADGNHAILRRRKAAEALTKDHSMAVAASHFRVVQKLKLCHRLIGETEQSAVGSNPVARCGHGVAREPCGEKATVLDERMRRPETIPTHLRAEVRDDGLLRRRRRDAARARIKVRRFIVNVQDLRLSERARRLEQRQGGEDDDDRHRPLSAPSFP